MARALETLARRALAPAPVLFLARLALCGAYLQGALVKAFDFDGALAEMAHFGLAPALPFALAVIALEIVAPVMILTGRGRWLGALALAGFTLLATVLANRFWELPPGEARFFMANSFFEHLGLAGAFVLVARYDLLPPRHGARHD